MKFLLEQIEAWPGVWKIVAAAVLAVVLGITFLKKDETKGMKLPPGPMAFPIVGNIDLWLRNNMAEKLAEVAWKENWPIMTLKVMSKRRAIVVSDPDIVKQMLVTQGQVFASRLPHNFAQRYMVQSASNKPVGVLFAPYGPTWRTNKKLMTVGQLQHRKIQGDTFLIELLKVLYGDIDMGVGALKRNGEQSFNVRNMICRVFLMKVFLVFTFGPGAEKYAEKIDALNRVMFNCLDFADFSEWFLPYFEPLIALYWGRIVSERTLNKKFEIFKRILADRERNGGVKQFSFCDSLDEAERNGEIDKESSMHLLDEVILAGHETTAGSIEGAMKMLASHPDVQKKIQDEMDEVIGKDRPMRVDDVEKLPYFKAFMKESFRMYRTVNIMVPHLSTESVKVGGYDIPKDSIIWVNLWALAHNPLVYPHPMELKPERFLGHTDADFTGKDTNYLVFGVGRRICPGVPLALTSTHLIVGSLAQRYTITLPSNWNKDRKTLAGVTTWDPPLEVCFTKRVGF